MTQKTILTTPLSNQIIKNRTYYISGLCGAGKTYQLTKYLCDELTSGHQKRHGHGVVRVDQTRHQNVVQISLVESHVISVATRALACQIANDLETHGLQDRVKLINTDTHPGRSVSELTDTLKNYGGTGAVIVTCHESLLRVPFIPETGWKIWADEMPGIDMFDNLRISTSRDIIKQWLTIEGDGPYPRVVPNSPNKLKKFLDNPPDDVHAKLRELLEATQSPVRTVYTEGKRWRKVIERGEISQTDSVENEVPFFGLLNPHVLRNFTLIGANIHETLLFKWLNMNGVETIAHPLTKELRFNKHRERDIEIYWAVKQQRNSKELLKKKNFLREYEKAVLELLGRERFLLLPNKTYEGSLKGGRAIPLPLTPHGLNRPEFMETTNFVSVGAFNRPPPLENFLKHLGFTNEDFCLDYYQRIYQAVMRSNLRVQNSNLPVRIVVPDLGVAEYLQSLFPGSQLKRLDGSFEKLERKKAMTSTERSRKFRAKKRLQV